MAENVYCGLIYVPEYMDIKEEAESKLTRLEAQLNDAGTKTTAELDYEGTTYKVLENLKSLT